MMWVLVLIVVIVLIFYLRKEGLESKDGKSSDGKSKESATKDDESKDSATKDDEGKDTKSSDSKSTTVVIVEGGNRYPPRTTDPFYAMTDPYWATYNYRVGPYPHRGQYIPRHRRIW